MKRTKKDIHSPHGGYGKWIMGARCPLWMKEALEKEATEDQTPNTLARDIVASYLRRKGYGPRKEETE